MNKSISSLGKLNWHCQSIWRQIGNYISLSDAVLICLKLNQLCVMHMKLKFTLKKIFTINNQVLTNG